MILFTEDITDEEEDESEEEGDEIPAPMSEEESESGGNSDMEDMESVAMSEAPDSARYDGGLDLDEERRALATIKGGRTLFFNTSCKV